MIPSRIGTKGITVPLENQQNYWVLTLVSVRGRFTTARSGAKGFWFFFSKKNFLLSRHGV
jgi:hypothetical protein